MTGALRKESRGQWKVGGETGSWGLALHLPRLSGGPPGVPFPRISFLVCKIKGQVRWSLGFFPALRTQKFSGRTGWFGLEDCGPQELPELGALPTCSHALQVPLGPGCLTLRAHPLPWLHPWEEAWCVLAKRPPRSLNPTVSQIGRVRTREGKELIQGHKQARDQLPTLSAALCLHLKEPSHGRAGSSQVRRIPQQPHLHRSHHQHFQPRL